jgi:hypothetical protein
LALGARAEAGDSSAPAARADSRRYFTLLFPRRPFRDATWPRAAAVVFIACIIVATTGNMYSGLWYPVIITAISVVVALIFLPETKDRSIHDL